MKFYSLWRKEKGGECKVQSGRTNYCQITLFTVTQAIDFEATFDQFDHYRLPNSRAVLELDHALIDDLLSGWLSTSLKTKCLLRLLSSHLIRSSESRLTLSYFLSTVGDVIAILFEMSLFSMGCSLM